MTRKDYKVRKVVILLYRMRSLRSILGYKELENQEIFLASTENQDDLYEGNYILYFHGDKALWQGLLFMLYEHVLRNTAILGDKYDEYSPYFSIPNDFNIAKKMYDYNEKDIVGLFRLKGINAFIECVSVNNITNNNDEKIIYESFLKSEIGSLLVTLMIIYSKSTKYFSLNKNDSTDNQYLLDFIDKVIFYIFSKKDFDSILDFNSKLHNLLSDFNAKKFLSDYRLIIDRLLKTFFDGIRILALEDCYIASFTTRYNDSRMWHDYTDYKGVCLEFKSNKSLSLNQIPSRNNSASTSVGKYIDYPFEKVVYGNKPKYNFFEILGKFPIVIIECIFNNYDFKKDEFNIFPKNETERLKYWEKTKRTVLLKDSDWSDQEEYRIIETDMLGIISNDEDRKYRYKFNELKSVILGEKIDSESEKKIVKILDEKCLDNNIHDFKVYKIKRNDSTGEFTKDIRYTLNRRNKNDI